MQAVTEVISTEDTIEVQWIALIGAETGNSEILSYNLWWDNGSGEELLIELCDEVTFRFTVTGLFGGTNY